MTKVEFTKAQSELSDLQQEVTKLILTKGAEVISTVYSTTGFRYKGFLFTVTMQLILVEGEESDLRRV